MKYGRTKSSYVRPVQWNWSTFLPASSETSKLTKHYHRPTTRHAAENNTTIKILQYKYWNDLETNHIWNLTNYISFNFRQFPGSKYVFLFILKCPKYFNSRASLKRHWVGCLFWKQLFKKKYYSINDVYVVWDSPHVPTLLWVNAINNVIKSSFAFYRHPPFSVSWFF